MERSLRHREAATILRCKQFEFPCTLMGGTSMILSTFCREQGTYHSAALLASFLAPAVTEKRLSTCPRENVRERVISTK